MNGGFPTMQLNLAPALFLLRFQSKKSEQMTLLVSPNSAILARAFFASTLEISTAVTRRIDGNGPRADSLRNAASTNTPSPQLGSRTRSDERRIPHPHIQVARACGV
jgi:hypothetical protein